MRNSPKIGFTERGDGGLDLSWEQKCIQGKVDGAVVITKNLTETCQTVMLYLMDGWFPLILHSTITGWGGTAIEPNVPDYKTELKVIKSFVEDSGFPIENVVLRIDPIFPTPKGLERVEQVLSEAFLLDLLPRVRCRISVLDEYPHVKQRFREMGFSPIYGDRDFSASPEQFAAVAALFEKHPIENKYETCAEPMLAKYAKEGTFVLKGCLSETDFKIMDINPPDFAGVNPQNRNGCLCMNGKTELLETKHRCPHQCAYCYWRD